MPEIQPHYREQGQRVCLPSLKIRGTPINRCCGTDRHNVRRALLRDVWGGRGELALCRSTGQESEKQLATPFSSLSFGELPEMPNNEVGTSKGFFIYVIRSSRVSQR